MNAKIFSVARDDGYPWWYVKICNVFMDLGIVIKGFNAWFWGPNQVIYALGDNILGLKGVKVVLYPGGKLFSEVMVHLLVVPLQVDGDLCYIVFRVQGDYCSYLICLFIHYVGCS